MASLLEKKSWVGSQDSCILFQFFHSFSRQKLTEFTLCTTDQGYSSEQHRQPHPSEGAGGIQMAKWIMRCQGGVRTINKNKPNQTNKRLAKGLRDSN